MPIHLVMHGHFYQPPRESPWTGRIERQESAAPFHDWNARIAAECYEPNARSRVLDEAGRIQDIVNNYEQLSFNFGPTLLAWLAEAAPAVLEALRAADRASLARLGHGNAVAQAYNHMILPLANRRDRLTQIRWGIREFVHRFGRRPEALWLPETAVDSLTLELLVMAGMRYLILSPAQAARWRPLGEARWTTATEAELDPRRPYRWRLRDGHGRPRGDLGIDLCFYHPSLSRGISFQHYLRDAASLAGRIAEAAAGATDPLVLIATDGESFGHHEPHGDMCLARLFTGEAPQRGLSVTNLAAFLERHRPAWEVELYPESAWSCSHGVGRWREDCGCSAGGGPGWNQRWRGPLRGGLDRVRDALATIFVEEGGRLLADVWAARDEYVELLLDPGETAREAFFARHQMRRLAAEERARALRLLEMQHQAMLMYTSCAWFFTDISGIETVQNLRYAARALELAEPFAQLDLEAVLLDQLARAQSNVPELKDGRRVWELWVRPSRVPPEEAVARLLLEGVLGRALAPHTFFRWLLTPGAVVSREGLLLAEVTARSQVTTETLRLAAACRRDGPFDFLAAVAPWPGGAEGWPRFVEEAAVALGQTGPGLEAWMGRTGARLIRLRDLLPDEQHAVLGEMLGPTMAALAQSREALCAAALPAAQAMVGVGIPLPAWIRTALEAGWACRLADLVQGATGAADAAGYGAALDLAAQARHLGLSLDLGPASTGFGALLLQRLDALADGGDPPGWEALLRLLQIGSRLGLSLPERTLQDRLFGLLRARLPALLERLRSTEQAEYPLVKAILAVAVQLRLDTGAWQQRLQPLEAQLAADPAYWP
jgi:alpha-amylase/alpha-mannosidase (GH57 family)